MNRSKTNKVDPDVIVETASMIEVPLNIEAQTNSPISFMALYQGLMPLTDWLLTAIQPQVVADIINGMVNSEIIPYPIAQTSDDPNFAYNVFTTGSYANGGLPPAYNRMREYTELSNKENASKRAFVSSDNGSLSASASLGLAHYLNSFWRDSKSNVAFSAWKDCQVFRPTMRNVPMLRDKKHRTAIIKGFGESFFDHSSNYHRSFQLRQSLSSYFSDATGKPLVNAVISALKELRVSSFILDTVVGEEYQEETGNIIPETDTLDPQLEELAKVYVEWVDANITSVDFISPVMRADTISFLNSKDEEVQPISLSDNIDSLKINPRVFMGVSSSIIEEFKLSPRDVFVDATMSSRNVTAHFKVTFPQEVVEYATQTTQAELQPIILSRLVNKAQTDLEDFDAVSDNPMDFGDHTQYLFGEPTIEETIEVLKQRPPAPAIGVNKAGLGVQSNGNIIYVPPSLDVMDEHNEKMAEYTRQLSEGLDTEIHTPQNIFDVPLSANYIGKGKGVDFQPENPSASATPIYIDWTINSVVGVDSRGNLAKIQDLAHLTPLTRQSMSNYSKAMLFEITPAYGTATGLNGVVAKALSKISSENKPNCYNAITRPMTVLTRNFFKKAVDLEVLSEMYTAFVKKNFKHSQRELWLLDDTYIESMARAIKSIQTNDPMSTLFGFCASTYAVADSRIQPDDPEAEDPQIATIIAQAQGGEADSTTLLGLMEYGTQQESLFAHLAGYILNAIWDLIKDNFSLLTNTTSYDMATIYYGTLKAIMLCIGSDKLSRKSLMSSEINTNAIPNDVEFKPKLLGSRDGYTMLPHQLRASYFMNALSGKADGINYAILSADAGAGKTHNIINDIVTKLMEKKITRPLIISPNYLEKNYIEDLAYIYAGKYNLFVIDTEIKNYSPRVSVGERFGLEGITNAILNAPPNTIFVTSYSFLSSGSLSKYDITLGTETTEINPHLDMILACGFDYVGADESQELRNEGTAKSDVAKAVFFRAKYRVLATGTFLNTSPSDIPAQTNVLDPTIFGTQKQFFDYYADDTDGKKGKVSRLLDSRKTNLVQTLKSGTAYIQIKRKEWAALLPERKDSYHVMKLGEDSIQWKLYQAVLKQVLDEIQKEINKNKAIARGAENEDEESVINLEAILRPYLQRLEMLLITPALDKDCERLLESLGSSKEEVENYVSPAVERAIQIMKSHIDGIDLKGLSKADRANAIADSRDFMGLDKLNQDELDKVEFIDPRPGKILVFCNYNTSVDAVYNALPPELKRQAIRYTASNKDEDIFNFKNDPSKRILIGIQNSLSTGHNLQNSDRLIRLEQVWSPGEVEQGESRINRPDPKNKGKLRSRIFYDWILIDGSIQITKMSRLISRMIVNNQIQEHGNPLYADVDYLPLLTMNLNTIANNCWFTNSMQTDTGATGTSLLSYLNTKNEIDTIQKEDYVRWAENYTGPTKPIEVESIKVDKTTAPGFKVITNIPPIPGQTIANADLFDVVNVAQYETMQGSQDLDLSGMRCLTPEGDGIIIGARGSKLRVEIGGAPFSFDRLAVNLYLGDKEYTQADLLKASGLTQFQTVRGVKVHVSGRNIRIDEEDQSIVSVDDEPRVIETRNSPKAIETVKTTKRKNDKPIPEPTSPEVDGEVEAFVASMNGKLAMFLSSEDADLLAKKPRRMLKDMGFHLEPDTLYAEIITRKVLRDFIDKITDKFSVDPQRIEELEELYENFNKGRTKRFNVESATAMGVTTYWLNERDVLRNKDPKYLSPMVMIQDGTPYVVMHSNLPSSVRAKRLRIANISWEESGGFFMKIYKTKRECVDDLRELQGSFTLTDKEQLRSDLKEMVLVRAKTPIKS